MLQRVSRFLILIFGLVPLGDHLSTFSILIAKLFLVLEFCLCNALIMLSQCSFIAGATNWILRKTCRRDPSDLSGLICATIVVPICCFTQRHRDRSS